MYLMAQRVPKNFMKDSPGTVHRFQSQRAVFRPRPKPHEQLRRCCIDIFHQADLFASFVDVGLMNTELIDPKQRTVIGPWDAVGIDPGSQIRLNQ